MNINRLLNTKTGNYIISIILGLGLATLFKKSCNNSNCIIYKAPDLNEIKQNIYKFNNECYNYIFNPGSCNTNKQIVNF